MKNKEKNAKEIIDVACSGYCFGMTRSTNKILPCNCITCRHCVFGGNLDCSETKREWAESEYIEKPVISKSDRAFLDYLKGYKYIARDGDGELYVYITKPKKGLRNWADARFKSLRGLDIGFSMVKWSDDEPRKIEDLKKLEVVDEYEEA